MVMSTLMRITSGFCPCIELASLRFCVTTPPLEGGTVEPDAGCICIFMYFGTAAWKVSSVIGDASEFVKVASTVVTLGLAASFEAAKRIVSPCFSNAMKVAGPLGEAVIIPPAAGIAPIAVSAGAPPIAGMAGVGAGATGVESPSKSINMSAAPLPPPPPRPPPAVAAGMTMLPIAGGAGGAPPAGTDGAPISTPPRMSASRSASPPTGFDGAAAATAPPPPPLPAPLPFAALAVRGAASGSGFCFFSRAGMRSSTPCRMESHWKSDEYSTARCCISSAIDERYGAISSRTRDCTSTLLLYREAHLTSALSTYSLDVMVEVTERSTDSSRSSACVGVSGSPPSDASPMVSAYSPMHHTPTCTRVCATACRLSLSAPCSLRVVYD
mmetsp:Transcript_17545/g.45336  ORF Transcript_17545/g.45336 Transcript_17545/m.45336 type:complete len:384 (+) Transcript_17545:256-1407(+)